MSEGKRMRVSERAQVSEGKRIRVSERVTV